jgi:DNA polymerase
MDYAQIEARLVAWLAGQIDVLKVFASGQDVYIHAAAQIFGIPPSEVTKDQRFFGKIAVLALGYQGGAGAFTSMARLYGVEVESSLADKIKVDWRAANPKVVQLWYDIERIAMNAVANPGKAFGLANGLLKFKVIDRWLYMLLPSGRRIAYFNPKLNGSVVVEGPEKGPKDGYNVYEAGTQLTYMGIDTYTRQWTRVSTYGGRLLQNACEGIARDLLAGGLLRLEAKGYNPLGSVHDEAITEPAEGHGSLDEAMQIFQEVPAWAKGLPIAAEGWRGKRYRK